MNELQIALTNFFKRFVSVVEVQERIDITRMGQMLQPNIPAITFSYATSNAFENTMVTFQVWINATNDFQLNEVCQAISDAVPLEGELLEIIEKRGWEYLDPTLIPPQWVAVEENEITSINIRFALMNPPITLEWRQVQGESSGDIFLQRGTPFIQPRPNDDPLIRINYGNIIARSYYL